ncbi:hypothetical protein ACKUB1_13750 [Methanospirillum stamsii]|uniref:Uncharacterized protein n=1 Tax=Methanospirillum stamsii TaxID=1277351 RepID=A0A2V2N4S8_9EURY|nr:hypothetical protein [Methanospirillum stamsii]PWR74829.1 hypothetical protein DLD82_07995 [Methanospirillum stamsii]
MNDTGNALHVVFVAAPENIRTGNRLHIGGMCPSGPGTSSPRKLSPGGSGMICHFITGCISNRTWNGLKNAASYGQNGMWACYLENDIISGCPVLIGVIFPSWKRFQLIRGQYGLTIYGEDEQTISDVKTSLFNMLSFTNEQINGVPA